MTAIYLAGPDVFRPDAEAHGEMLKALCAEFGFLGLYPLDHALPAFEVGYALALGKPVYAYLSDAGAYAERLARLAPEWLGERPGEDRDGWQLEGFGLPLNLMLAVPSRLVAGGPREALRRLAEELGGNA